MFQAFIIVLREGFEAFLIVAITLAYLRKTNQNGLVPAVHWGILLSVAVSALLGYALYKNMANQPLLEGWLALISAFLIAGFAIHMWQMGPKLKQEMEQRLYKATSKPTSRSAYFGVLAFTVFMIAREGMETALLLIQIHEPQIVQGVALGVLAAASMAFLWARYGYRINLKLFFQVTAIFLFLFVAQVLMYSFHEFTEAGVFPNSEALHIATEPYSPDGLYGKWFSLGMVGICAVWLVFAWLSDKVLPKSAVNS